MIARVHVLLPMVLSVFGAPSVSGDDVVCCAIVSSTPYTTGEILLHCKNGSPTSRFPPTSSSGESLPKRPPGKILRGQL